MEHETPLAKAEKIMRRDYGAVSGYITYAGPVGEAGIGTVVGFPCVKKIIQICGELPDSFVPDFTDYQSFSDAMEGKAHGY